MAQFEETICNAYHRVPLRLVGFTMYKAEKSKKIIKLSPQPAAVSEIEAAVGRGRLILLPHQDIALQQVS